MATDIDLKNFAIHKMNLERYEEMKQAGTLPPNSIIVTKDIQAAPFMPIGMIFPSAIPQTDARVHLLDGSVIMQEGLYANFVTLLKTLISSGYNLSCTEDEYLNDLNNTGNCGKFVIDDTAGTVRLPTITTYIEGTIDLINLGISNAAGLPNITGTVGASDGANAYLFAHSNCIEGAFENDTTTTAIKYSVDLSTSTSKTAWSNKVKFDASKSNSIYGNSTTVQTNSTEYPYYIVLAAGYKASEIVNADNVLTEVNSKLPLAGGTLTGDLHLTKGLYFD